MFLIYECFWLRIHGEGSLFYALRNDVGGVEFLNWMKRVTINKDNAPPMSYLHHGWTPPIVHRDI